MVARVIKFVQGNGGVRNISFQGDSIRRQYLSQARLKIHRVLPDKPFRPPSIATKIKLRYQKHHTAWKTCRELVEYRYSFYGSGQLKQGSLPIKKAAALAGVKLATAIKIL